MWKYVSRAVREAIEKSNGLFHCRTINAQENGNLCQIFNNVDQNEKAVSEKIKQIHHDGDENDSFDKFRVYHRNLIRALSCTTGMILGWCSSQYISRHERSLQLRNCKRCRIEYYSLVKPKIHVLLPSVAFAQPLYTVNNTITSDNQSNITTNVTLNSTNDAQIETPTDRDNYSALEDAAEKFAVITGQLENQLGAAFIQDSNAAQSFEHFEAGTVYKNSSAAFNLGLCYELGIGTKQNFEKAADCYKVAVELGHSRAMYNLAIYYVQGRGGLPIDFNQARLLFTKAARQGHKESIAALRSEGHVDKPPMPVTSAFQAHNDVAFATTPIPLINGIS